MTNCLKWENCHSDSFTHISWLEWWINLTHMVFTSALLHEELFITFYSTSQPRLRMDVWWSQRTVQGKSRMEAPLVSCSEHRPVGTGHHCGGIVRTKHRQQKPVPQNNWQTQFNESNTFCAKKNDQLKIILSSLTSKIILMK